MPLTTLRCSLFGCGAKEFAHSATDAVVYSLLAPYRTFSLTPSTYPFSTKMTRTLCACVCVCSRLRFVISSSFIRYVSSWSRISGGV